MPHLFELMTTDTSIYDKNTMQVISPNCIGCDCPVVIDGIIQYGKNKGEPVFLTKP